MILRATLGSWSMDLDKLSQLIWGSELVCYDSQLCFALKFKTLRCLVNFRSLSLPAYEFGV